MNLSKDGESKLILREGSRRRAYQDTKGIWTIGIGHTGPEVKRGLVWTNDKILEVFREDVKWAEEAVSKVKAPLKQHQFDALVSFVFNIGESQWSKSTMKRMLDAGMYTQAALQFDRWRFPPEILSRRMSEKEQFLGR